MTPDDTKATQPAPGYYGHSRPEVVELIPAGAQRVLDVGCAAGAMGAAMKARGVPQVMGLEVMPAAAEAARKHLDAVHLCDLESYPALPFPDGHFDVITCADVLEHLRDPVAVLRHLRRYLRGDGLLIASIPNVRNERVVAELLIDGRWRYRDEGILDRTHLRFFTWEEIQLLVRDAGFVLGDQVRAIRTKPTPRLEILTEVVGLLGGDRARFAEEATVMQFLFTARPAA